MDSNGNLNYAERLALRPGDRVVYQTETLAHRGEMTGMVSRVGESGIVYIGKRGSRYALLSDYVRRADRLGEAERPAEDTPKAPDAPGGRETASVEALQARVAALTADRDIVYCKVAKLQCVLREIVSVLAGDGDE